MSNPRPLPNNAIDAVSDVAELLNANRRAISGGLKALFNGNQSVAGDYMVTLADNNDLADRILTYLLAGQTDIAANLMSEERQKDLKQ